jgi:signal transduction histidine kinase
MRLGEAGVTVTNDIPEDLPAVPGGVVELRQVLINVINNAIDATGGNGRINLSARVLPQNGRRPARVELAVADNGPGISPQELEHLFEPFYTTKQVGYGTGLGLTIVDHIVRAHRGEVVADSTLGVGTTLRIRLPLET